MYFNFNLHSLSMCQSIDKAIASIIHKFKGTQEDGGIQRKHGRLRWKGGIKSKKGELNDKVRCIGNKARGRWVSNQNQM